MCEDKWINSFDREKVRAGFGLPFALKFFQNFIP
jgi:hypothetical protein